MNAVLATTLVIGTVLFFSTVFRNIGLAMIINPDALMIVLGGTIVAVFIGFPCRRLKNTVQDIADSFLIKRDDRRTARDILEIATIYRRADMRGLERKLKTVNDDFLKMGVNLLMNNQTNGEIRFIMERAVTNRATDYIHSQNVLKAVARLTPSFGLAGTVISLIKMFEHMQSMDTIAPHMAVAMMSTFYGVIISNLFMLPLCAKLEEHAIQTETVMHRTIDSIEAINQRDHPLTIEEKLNGYYLAEDLNPVELGSV